jgi:hypothetical protein
VSHAAFSFILHVDDPHPAEEMVYEVATAVIRQVGYPQSVAEDLGAAVGGAFAERHLPGSPCDVQFRADEGELKVTVSCPRGHEWRIARRLP